MKRASMRVYWHRLRKQRGAVLVLGLILLLVLSLLAFAIIQVVNLQAKMARNFRDQSVAFQAAEAALRRAEVDIANGTITSESSGGPFRFDKFSAACTISSDTASYGRCLPSTTTSPQWQSVAWSPTSTNTIGVSLTLPSGVSSPRYIVELLSGQPVFDSSTGCSAAIFRISSKGYGPNSAVSNLQAVYRYQPSNCT